VPDDYIRKQTIANAERYVTPELADLEARILSAADRLAALEQAAVESLRERVGRRETAAAIASLAERVATLDVCAALAQVAHTGSYVRPLVDDSGVIDIEDGRHPVIEQMVPAGTFVPKRLPPRGDAAQLLVVTGPNMAGKSTFMRQVAHIVLLAQMGGFVRRGAPASVSSTASSPALAPPTTWRAASRPSWSRCARPPPSSPGDPPLAARARRDRPRHLHLRRCLDRLRRRRARARRRRRATLFATHYHELIALAEGGRGWATSRWRCARGAAR
jgi:DNA mismatch repair ATPase MutS